MAFDVEHKNRKDHRKPYYKSKAFDRSCRNHGSCGYCHLSRLHRYRRAEPLFIYVDLEIDIQLENFLLELRS